MYTDSHDPVCLLCLHPHGNTGGALCLAWRNNPTVDHLSPFAIVVAFWFYLILFIFLGFVSARHWDQGLGARAVRSVFIAAAHTGEILTCYLHSLLFDRDSVSHGSDIRNARAPLCAHLSSTGRPALRRHTIKRSIRICIHFHIRRVLPLIMTKSSTIFNRKKKVFFCGGKLSVTYHLDGWSIRSVCPLIESHVYWPPYIIPLSLFFFFFIWGRLLNVKSVRWMGFHHGQLTG